jgi:hypothetical protein
MRQSLVRIWVFTTAILLFFLLWTTIPELYRARRFETAQAALTQLSPAERLQVLDRIAWLNGLSTMPSVPPVSGSDLSQQLRTGIDIANARLAAARPLPSQLEGLARDANVTPQWDAIRWRMGLFVGTIALLWALLFLGFWITSEERRSARQGKLRKAQPASISAQNLRG